jgi:hypothetical protein
MGTVLHRVPLEKAIFILVVLRLHLHRDSSDDFLHVRNMNPSAGDQTSPPLWIPCEQSELELLAHGTEWLLLGTLLLTALRETGALRGPIRAAVQQLSNSGD